MKLNQLFSNMSDMRTRYALRLVGRVIVLLIGWDNTACCLQICWRTFPDL
mgnify:CR=1 FL=1